MAVESNAGEGALTSVSVNEALRAGHMACVAGLPSLRMNMSTQVGLFGVDASVHKSPGLLQEPRMTVVMLDKFYETAKEGLGLVCQVPLHIQGLLDSVPHAEYISHSSVHLLSIIPTLVLRP